MPIRNISFVLAGLCVILLTACSQSAEARHPKDSLDWLMAKHIKALGGAEALNAVKSRESNGVAHGVKSSGVDFTSKWHSYLDIEGRSFNESYVRLDTGEDYNLEHRMAVQPTGGWNIGGDDNKIFDFPAEMAAGMTKNRVVLTFDFPVRYKSMPSEYDLERLPDTTKDGKLYHVVGMGTSEDSITQYIDSQTYLTDKWVTTGKYGLVFTETYSDYRKVNGVMIAHTITSETISDGDDNPQTQNTQIEKIVLNGDFDQARFERPAD